MHPQATPRWSWSTSSRETLIMGVLNLTPDSFSDGGRWQGRAVERALQMVEEGADLIDIGGESSRPGASPVPLEEELERVIPAIRAIRAESDIPISVDTVKAEVARQALAEGAEVINDIEGLRDDALLTVVSEASAGVVIMHMRGRPQTMQRGDLSDDDIVGTTLRWLAVQAARAEHAGVAREAICLDPGIGFGKTVEQNCALIAGLPRLRALGYPVLVGASRKSFIGALTGAPVSAREWGSAAANSCAVFGGARVLRVHDVRAAREQATVAAAIRDVHPLRP